MISDKENDWLANIFACVMVVIIHHDNNNDFKQTQSYFEISAVWQNDYCWSLLIYLKLCCVKTDSIKLHGGILLLKENNIQKI